MSMSPGQIMSYWIISCHMSCIKHEFTFYLVSRACWFLPLCSIVVNMSWSKYTLNSFASGGRSKRCGPLLVVNIFGTTRGWEGSKIFQASHWPTCQSPPPIVKKCAWTHVQRWDGGGGAKNGPHLDSQKYLNDYWGGG